jgi:hypothetical protein
LTPSTLGISSSTVKSYSTFRMRKRRQVHADTPLRIIVRISKTNPKEGRMKYSVKGSKKYYINQISILNDFLRN